VPNVTAIDWKQADVYGQLKCNKGGMSFTVYEARAAFVVFARTAFTLAGVKTEFEPQCLPDKTAGG
jgi:hypothetical protein